MRKGPASERSRQVSSHPCTVRCHVREESDWPTSHVTSESCRSRCLPRSGASEDIHGPQRLTRREPEHGPVGGLHPLRHAFRQSHASLHRHGGVALQRQCHVRFDRLWRSARGSWRARSQQPSLARWPIPRCHSILSLHLRRRLGTTPVLWRGRSTRLNPTPTSQTLNRRLRKGGQAKHLHSKLPPKGAIPRQWKVA